jgi:hypothetical protein
MPNPIRPVASRIHELGSGIAEGGGPLPAGSSVAVSLKYTVVGGTNTSFGLESPGFVLARQIPVDPHELATVNVRTSCSTEVKVKVSPSAMAAMPLQSSARPSPLQAESVLETGAK